MKKNIKKELVKTYFSIKGFLKTVFKLKKEKEYTPMAVLSSSDYITKYYYRGDRTFCIIRQTIIPVIGGEAKRKLPIP